MIVYPRSLAGLNLNPKKEESESQTNDIETLLQRISKETYLRESGWEIVRTQKKEVIRLEKKWVDFEPLLRPAESTCEFKNGI